MRRVTYWRVMVYIIASRTTWTRSFGFKPMMEDILNALYAEWNGGAPWSKLCRDLRLFVAVADRAPFDFSDDSGTHCVVEIEDTPVGHIRMKKEEMYTR